MTKKKKRNKQRRVRRRLKYQTYHAKARHVDRPNPMRALQQGSNMPTVFLEQSTKIYQFSGFFSIDLRVFSREKPQKNLKKKVKSETKRQQQNPTKRKKKKSKAKRNKEPEQHQKD
jgi:hypothetical protein